MKFILTIVITLCVIKFLAAQDSISINKSDSDISIYLDCSSCDIAYLAENIPYVNFLTEPHAADVHLIITKMSTGNSSTAVSIVYIGQNRFKAQRDTLTFTVPEGLTREEKRILELEKIQLGLVPFLMKTPIADQLMLFVNHGLSGEKGAQQKDPWHNWAFEIYGNGSLSSQKNYNASNIDLGLNITRSTESFKFESGTMLDYNESMISFPYYDTLTNSESFTDYKTCQKGFYHSSLLVFSIGKHFGAGGTGLVKNDPRNNMDLRMQAGPAIEFNIFPYEESLHKQFRFIYALLYEQTKYIEPTIFDKMTDEGLKHKISVITRISNEKAYLSAALQGCSYVQNISRYSLSGTALASIRLYKNLSFSIQCYMGMYRDQIQQPKGYASLDEILTRQKEMATDYQYGISFGISYHFGSKKFPALNPRFDD